jgi:hypothetical protein
LCGLQAQPKYQTPSLIWHVSRSLALPRHARAYVEIIIGIFISLNGIQPDAYNFTGFINSEVKVVEIAAQSLFMNL